VSDDLATINLQTGLPERDVSASGVWTRSSVRRPETRWTIRRVGQIAGIVLTIAASPATAVSDYWFWERRRRGASSVAWLFEGVVGRPISRAEALRIASQILERAERERLELAEWEAKRGIQWEEGE
jgi:hypothetical protein